MGAKNISRLAELVYVEARERPLHYRLTCASEHCEGMIFMEKIWSSSGRVRHCRQCKWAPHCAGQWQFDKYVLKKPKIASPTRPPSRKGEPVAKASKVEHQQKASHSSVPKPLPKKLGAAPKTPPTQEEQAKAELDNMSAELKAKAEEWVRTESREREGLFYWWNPVTGATQHDIPTDILDYRQHLSYSTMAVPKAQPQVPSSAQEPSEMNEEYEEFLAWKRFQEMKQTGGQSSQSNQ